jgi:hypothetical protein
MILLRLKRKDVSRSMSGDENGAGWRLKTLDSCFRRNDGRGLLFRSSAAQEARSVSEGPINPAFARHSRFRWDDEQNQTFLGWCVPRQFG